MSAAFPVLLLFQVDPKYWESEPERSVPEPKNARIVSVGAGVVVIMFEGDKEWQ